MKCFLGIIVFLLLTTTLSSCQGNSHSKPTTAVSTLPSLTATTSAGDITTTTTVDVTKNMTTSAVTTNSVTASTTQEKDLDMEEEHKRWVKNKDIAVDKTKQRLTACGWSNFTVETLSEARYMYMYDVVGIGYDKDGNALTVRTTIVFSSFMPEGELDFVSYESESGRVYTSEDVLSPLDERIYEFMTSH